MFWISDLTLEEASELIKQRHQQQMLKLNKMFLYSTVEYISQTLLQHYHLFILAFNKPRVVEQHNCQLNVQVSPYEVLNLADSTQIDQWKMENDLRTEEEKYVVEETVCCSFAPLFIYSFIQSFIQSVSQLIIHYLLIHSFIQSFI